MDDQMDGIMEHSGRSRMLFDSHADVCGCCWLWVKLISITAAQEGRGPIRVRVWKSGCCVKRSCYLTLYAAWQDLEEDGDGLSVISICVISNTMLSWIDQNISAV